MRRLKTKEERKAILVGERETERGNSNDCSYNYFFPSDLGWVYSCMVSFKGQGPVGIHPRICLVCVFVHVCLFLCVQCVSVTAIIQALLLSRYISGFNLFSHRLLFHLSLSSLSLHLSLTQNQITFTLMTVELKQWKTNISQGDKTLLKPIIPSLPLPFYLCGCLSPSLTIPSSVFHFQFLYCQSPHPSPWMTQTAMRTWGGQCSLLESRWMFNVSKDRQVHKLSWTHGIASLQSELCLSAIVKVMRLHLNGYEVFLRAKGESPLMILSRFCPRRTF